MGESESSLAISSQVPIAKPETLYVPPTSFEYIGISDSFNMTRNGNVGWTDLIPLPGLSSAEHQFNTFAVQLVVPGHIKKVYSVRMTDKEEVVGHADFTDKGEKNAKINFHYFYFYDEIRQQIQDENIRKLIPNDDVFPGLWVKENYRGERIGELLWALGCGYMEQIGKKVIYISKDSTMLNMPTSFYAKYGATPPDAINKCVVSHLSPIQELSVARAFNINLLEQPSNYQV